MFLLIFCSVISALQLYNNYTGIGLSAYPVSFSIRLAYFSLGNNNTQTQEQMYLQCSLACLQAIVLMIFGISWRASSHLIIKEYLNNPDIVEPERYALTVTGLKEVKRPRNLD